MVSYTLVRLRRLMHLLPIEQNLATAGSQHAAQQADQQGFTTTHQSNDRHDFTWIEVKLLYRQRPAVVDDFLKPPYL